jgi:hypothetical protein
MELKANGSSVGNAHPTNSAQANLGHAIMDLNDLAQQGKQIYENNLRHDLELNHLHQFVSIEPISGDYFLGNTMSEAIQSARSEYPDRLVYTMRVGHPATLEFGDWGITPPNRMLRPLRDVRLET